MKNQQQNDNLSEKPTFSDVCTEQQKKYEDDNMDNCNTLQ